MTGQPEAYVLLAVALLVVAAALACLVVLTGSLLRRLVGPVLERWDVGRWGGESAVVRRCEACGKGWRALPHRGPSLPRLRAARAVRRRAATQERDVPQWARPQGWGRCPSCLSTRVRTSGDAPLPAVRPAPRGAVLAGMLTAGLGLLMVTAATLGYLTGASTA